MPHLFILGDFMSYLSTHAHIAYLILFTGMYLETLVITNILLPGEIFLLAGSILAGAHVLALPFVMLALYAGAIFGDSSSYWIGRKLGPSIFKEGRVILNPKNYARGEAFFKKFGQKAIFFARLIGPFNLITPFLSGIYGISYKTFLTYNLPGVLIGVGEFIVIGYFFGTHYETVFLILHRYLLVVLGAIAVFIAARWYMKSQRQESAEK
jgi:membrane-associated protein